MTGIDFAQIGANLRIVGFLAIFTAIDWLLGIVVAIRAGTFDVRLLPDQLKAVATYLLGLGIAAGATGLRLAAGDFDVGVVLQIAFIGWAAAYGAKLVADYKDKIAALAGGPSAARAYFGKPS